MATSIDFIDFVCEQLSDFGSISYKKMFGEFMIYLNNKPIFIVCNARVYVKKHPEIENLLNEESVGFPYKGSKEHYIVDIENKDIVEPLLFILDSIVPVPKPKKKKSDNK